MFRILRFLVVAALVVLAAPSALAATLEAPRPAAELRADSAEADSVRPAAPEGRHGKSLVAGKRRLFKHLLGVAIASDDDGDDDQGAPGAPIQAQTDDDVVEQIMPVLGWPRAGRPAAASRAADGGGPRAGFRRCLARPPTVVR
jgi:hypothetical protein